MARRFYSRFVQSSKSRRESRGSPGPVPWASGGRAPGPLWYRACVQGRPPCKAVGPAGGSFASAMKIRALETIRLGEFPNLLWVRVHSDEGLIGLGETFMGASVVETYLHDVAAPQLLGEDPLEVERIARSLVGYLGFRSTGAEMRGNSAIDLALWDLWGKSTGQPVYQLLGGAFRRSVRVYNTCAGYRYIRAPGQAVANWGLPEAPELPYEDLDAFLHRAGDLAHSLLEQGVTAMKIWPFDPYAEGSAGLHISPSDLKRALGPFEAIRGAVGDRMDIMVEFHSLWNLPAAIRIARALEPYGTFLARGPDPYGQPGEPEAVRPAKSRSRVRLGDLGRQGGLP